MSVYRLLPGLVLRAPFYSASRYAPVRLASVLGTEVFRRAVMLASPALYAALEAKRFVFDLLTEKERFTLMKYYNRMSFRPVPFGAFASFTVTDFGTGNAQVDEGEGKLFLWSEPEQDDRRLELNPMLYRRGKEFRYVRRHDQNAADRYVFSLDAIAAEPLLVRLFGLLEKGFLKAEELISEIAALTGCTAAESADYIGFLTAEGLLISEGAGELIRNTAVLKGVGYSDYAVLERDGAGGPSEADREELEAGVRVIQLLSPGTARRTALINFRKAFADRFGDRKVPLLLALDPDAGLTYGDDHAQPENEWTAIHRLFLKRWIREGKQGLQEEIVLHELDLNNLATDKVFSPTASVLFRKTGDDLLLEHVGGATATALAGRFTLFSDRLLEICRDIVKREALSNPGVVFADISCPSGRHVDHINLRRRIYDYEIALGAYQSGEHILMPSDLLLSVRGDELILESQRLQKRVVPRLSSAFNPRHNGLGIFRLLCDLQYQGQASTGFDLEALFPGMPAYPRIRYGRCILEPAKWRLQQGEIPGGIDELRELRLRLSLPRQLSCGTGDQKLIFDLSDEDEAQFFLKFVQNMEKVTLTEYLAPGRSVMCGHRELAGQYLAFLAHDQEVFKRSTTPIAHQSPPLQRRFLPGSQWLYLKLYAQETMTNRVLLDVVRPVLRQAKDDFDQWFFIRYTDPDPHIRLRLRRKDPASGLLLALIAQRAGSVGSLDLIKSVQVEPYERELERYGAKRMEAVEAVFAAGSELSMAAIVKGLPEMSFALLTVARMCEVFLPDKVERVLFVGRRADAFKEEFKTEKTERLALDADYRELRPALESIFRERPLKKQTGRLLETIQKLVADGDRKLLADLCHMQINRSFASTQRRKEMELWYFLQKWLKRPDPAG
ncbi:hypothetical protein FPZ42_07005 [Mucilaginibacter achroorhodeus]|uniref:Thiopeptide-type bacteriocin biosynthesis protein n=1 Tax=Mucilaginibacter achroorhodeus TaxID=2599294 RepID=A0A563U637_9SPHI|nr:thiopeptide-type bacteriocin biosynthesis protein [Mucilaginibacter achroorhodeus]TWR26779.1 hypothetical protein FPZ42_07005 [Mucilaginibacter achroorhodeus]